MVNVLINDLPFIMIRCLLITLIIELIVAFIIKIRDKKDLINVALVNLLTNPIVVSVPILVYINYFGNSQKISLIILEVLTLFVEGFVYSKVLKYKKINPYLISLILNCSSYFLGELVNHIF